MHFSAVFLSATAVLISANGVSPSRHQSDLQDEEGPVIRISDGEIQGLRSKGAGGKDVDVFWGIPFAEPPVGDRRFRAPVKAKSWTGVRDATKRPNTCVQIVDTMFPGFSGSEMWNPNTPQSEDCLYLNVAVPRPYPNNSAVMIWIYGGSYYTGTSTLDVYDPRTLASEQNVIVVSLQYRVASLGFLYVEGVGGVEGNAGLLDQRMAIKWVRNNIAAFGGNKDNITLFSESAGSASVAFHLLSPGSRPLFSQAILQSAAATNPWAMVTQKEAKLRARRLAETLKCPHSENEFTFMVECLRRVNATKLVNAEWDAGIASDIMACPFVPVLDGVVFPESPARALARKNFKHTKLLLGTNRNEGYYFLIYFLAGIFKLGPNVTMSRSEFVRAVKDVNMYVSPVGLHAIEYEYTDWIDANNSAKMSVALDQMVADYQFVCPTLKMAQSYADASLEVYEYYFDHRSTVHPWPGWSGVLHGDEINFIFGEPLNTTHFNYTEEEKELSREMMTMWANFAKTGNPNKFANGSWLPDFYWPIYSPTLKEYLVINTGKKGRGMGLNSRKCAFWNNYLPSLLASNDPTDECISYSCRNQCAVSTSSTATEGFNANNGPTNGGGGGHSSWTCVILFLILLVLIVVLAGS